MIEIGQSESNNRDAAVQQANRSLKVGDQVAKGQLLAVVWSKNVADKKSQLVMELLRLHDDAATPGPPQRTEEEQQRFILADRIAVEQLERTLRTWQFKVEDLSGLHAEAHEMRRKSAAISADQKRDWGRVVIRAPTDGTLTELNVALKDVVQPVSVLLVVTENAAPRSKYVDQYQLHRFLEMRPCEKEFVRQPLRHS